jgi:hypothetical protein
MAAFEDMGMKKEISRAAQIGRLAVFLIIAAVLVLAATAVLKPKRLENPYDNTRKERGFYMEERDSLDLIFVGSSELFSTVNPSVLEKEQGYRSYVFAGNEQPFSISYYYIMEALKYQKPQAIVLEVSYCNWGKQPREAVVRLNFDDMRWGKAKILGIMNNVPRQEWEYYFLEISKYHSRWDSLTQEDWKWWESYYSRNPAGGWSAFDGGEESGEDYGEQIPQERKVLDPAAMAWLEKIVELCEENGVQLILFKTPNGGKIIDQNVEEGSEDAFRYIDGVAYYNELGRIAGEKGIPFLDMNRLMTGRHHNDAENAEKATRALGEWLAETVQMGGNA